MVSKLKSVFPTQFKNKLKRVLGHDIPKGYTTINGRNIVFIRIPKSASTSIAHVLGYTDIKHLKDAHKFDKNGREISTRERRVKFIPHSDLREYSDLMGESVLKDAFIFTFIRNPWDKALSHFRYYERINQHRLGELPIDFNQWVDWVYGDIKHPYYCHSLKLFQDFHDWVYHPNPAIKPDFIGKVENIEEDWQKVSEMIGLDERLEMTNKSKRQTSELRKQLYNDHSAELIYQHHKRDIERWNYSFDD